MPVETIPEVLPRQDSPADDPWIAQVDGAVTEVFEVMFSQRCILIDPVATVDNAISARITLSGIHTGLCIVRVGTPTAHRLTDTMLGEGIWDDQMIEDAVGELCNLIAGGWKSRLGDAASGCEISTPAISRNPADHAHPTPSAGWRCYAFNGYLLQVALATH